MYVRSLSIQNLRGFESAELSLCHPGEGTGQKAGSAPYLDNVTLLLGGNGAGKTSVLRAVALSALAPVLAIGSGYVPYALVRRVEGRPAGNARATARVLLHEQDGLKEGDEEDMTATLMAPPRGYTDRFLVEKQPPWHDRLYDEESPAFLVLGYGATRRVETGPASVEGSAKERILRYRRVAGLFEEHVTLMPMSAWLPQVHRKNKKRHREIVTLLNKLLPDTQVLCTREQHEKPEVLFQRGGSVLPYPALSDGDRAFISWVGDVLYHLDRSCPKDGRLVDMRGVVLVDEVDLHLHPAWQRHLVPNLSRALPNLQFVLTTHSPRVAGTLSSRNVRLLEEHEQTGGVRATTVVEPRAADKARESATEPLPANPEPLVLRGHQAAVNDVAWAPSGLRLASASADHTLRLWDVETGGEPGVLRGHEAAVLCVAWDSTGGRLASGSVDTRVRVWDARTRRELMALSGHEGSVFSVAWDPSGRRLASASFDRTVRIWDVETGSQLAVLRDHEGPVLSVAWDPLGRRLASASHDATVRIWDAETGGQLAVIRPEKAWVRRVAWRSPGRQLTGATSANTVHVWDAETGSEQRVLRGGQDTVYSVAWEPSGRWLASAAVKTVHVWDVEPNRELAVLRGHEDIVYIAVWAPSGRRLASASVDSTVRVWDLACMGAQRHPAPDTPGQLRKAGNGRR